MLNLLERSIASLDQRLLLLAPPDASAHGFLQNVTVDPQLHEGLMERMQRHRGDIYLKDGAIASEQLSRDGRHQTPEDERSWHLLMLGQDYSITACIWYLEYENTIGIERLRARNCPLATDRASRHQFRKAVESELARARRDDLRYAEVGGWAASPDSRCTDGLFMILAVYALAGISGHARVLSTATVRHGSSTILRRLGGSPLVADSMPIPAYHDSRYGCEMELLRFDTRQPNARYMPTIAALTDRLANAPVVGSTDLAEPFEQVTPAAASASLFAA
jgi:hypothetical protein